MCGVAFSCGGDVGLLLTEQLALEVLYLHEDCMFCNWGTCFTGCGSKNPLAGLPWLLASPPCTVALGLPLLLQFKSGSEVLEWR